MNLRILTPPHWAVARSLLKWSRKLKIPLVKGYQPVDVVIVIGNGVPDNIMCMILAHKLNGTRIIGLTKPERSLSGTFHELAFHTRVRKIVVILDQEDRNLDEVWRYLETELRRAGIKINIVNSEPRLCIYSCSYGNHLFEVIAVINGLEMPYRKHTIEDHLLKICEELCGSKLSQMLGTRSVDPKEMWNRLRNMHFEVYSYILKANISKLEEIFHYHIKALKLVLEETEQRTR
ncbi:MAG: hypothetical protein DRJ41_00670 [Thermoprotei archaeon]|nr:MAG: hypothetical protein DRJ41_00670 [Thermoprotei archaeon]